MIKRIAILSALAFPAPAPAYAAAPPPSVLSIDADGNILLERDAGRARHPASLTKMMTAYLVLDALDSGALTAQTKITVSERAAQQGGSVLGLAAGAAISAYAALHALILRSANDAATALAEHLAGTESAFAEQMTAKARALGMNSTRFLNATGLTAPGHLTTARDMAILAVSLLRDHPKHRALFSATAMNWGKASLPSVNAFLTAYPGAEGLKTGFTCPAGYNLAAAAFRGNRHAVTVVMGAAGKDERLSLAVNSMNKAFAASPGASVTQLPNIAGSPPDLSAVVCSGAVPGDSGRQAVLPKGWGLEVSFSRDRSAALKQLNKTYAALKGRLGGGKPALVVRPFDGGLRYRGLIVGLRENQAVPVCLDLRKKDEDSCLVLQPAAVEGAADEERRWRMLSAR